LNLRREQLVLLLGGFICTKCGYDDARAIQIDHIYANGQDMPLAKTGVIEYYLENPDEAFRDLQILCANCHIIKTLENNERTGRTKVERFYTLEQAKKAGIISNY